MNHALVTFTSQSGSANDAKLAELLETALIGESKLLVSFEAVTEYESGDWEHSIPGYTFAELGHSLSDEELAMLVTQIEMLGTLNEGGAYNEIDKIIETVGEGPAAAARAEAATDRQLLRDLDAENRATYVEDIPMSEED